MQWFAHSKMTPFLAALTAVLAGACSKSSEGDSAAAPLAPPVRIQKPSAPAPAAAPPAAAMRAAHPAAPTPAPPGAAAETRRAPTRARHTAPSPSVGEVVAPIENPEKLDRFFRALATTAKKKGTTRIVHYGASVLGSDGPTSVTRRKLWKEFGNAGKGWVNVAPGWKWYRPRDVSFKPRGWKSRTVVNHQLKDGRYGLGGVAAIGGPGARTTFEATADRLELWYKAGPKSGSVSITIDDEPPQVFELTAETEQDAWKRLDLKPGKHKITLKVERGVARLYGVVLEQNDHGVVYDTIPLIGARGSRLLKFDESHLAGQLRHRAPDLVIANFGGNELVDERMNMSVYERQYRTALERLFRPHAGASCLVMGPTDHARKEDGRVRPDPQLPKVIAVQKKLAKELGCAFYDSTAATGGLGVSIRTQRTDKPLYYTDYAHLTPEGNKVLGTQTYRALMSAYRAWNKQGGKQ